MFISVLCTYMVAKAKVSSCLFVTVPVIFFVKMENSAITSKKLCIMNYTNKKKNIIFDNAVSIV